MDYYSHSPDTGRLLERLADTDPTTLACMHGSAWRGDGAALAAKSRLATGLIGRVTLAVTGRECSAD